MRDAGYNPALTSDGSNFAKWQVGATPDFPMLLQKVLMTDPAGAVNLALQIGQMTPPPMDFNYIADLFLQV